MAFESAWKTRVLPEAGAGVAPLAFASNRNILFFTLIQESVLFERQDTKNPLHELRRVRSVLLAACAALALAGCGGGSGSDSGVPTEPTADLAAPEGFRVSGGFRDALFDWRSVIGATHYELYADPDGPGPLPEGPIEDMQTFNDRASEWEDTLSSRLSYAVELSRFYATYRLRACDASGCGAFTEPQAADFGLDETVAWTSHKFASGYGNFGVAQLSQDGLTLYYSGGVFGRSSALDAWQPQTLIPAGKGVL